MEEKGKKGRYGNIVLFPFMAQGHLNPFIGLANLLAFRYPSLTLTIVSTPANVLHLRTIFSAKPSFRFAELPFNSSENGLPPDIEHARFLPRQYVAHFNHAAMSLQPSFHRLIESMSKSNGCDHPPLLAIVSDMFLAWSVDVARAFGVYHAVFYATGPYGMSIFKSLWTHTNLFTTDDEEITLPDLPHITIHRSQVSDKMKSAAIDPNHLSISFLRRMFELWRLTDACLWNTAAAIERQSLNDWSRSSGQICWAVGPLNLAAPRRTSPPSNPLSRWLDQQKASSVVYISFGSQNSIGRRQMVELACGLEASGRPFVWAIRPPIESFSDASAAAKTDPEQWDLTQCLPEGFEERIRESEQGLLMRGWAPQLDILGHVATGAFISHFGWNSVMEALSCGVPLIGWPLNSDQFYNSKLVAEELGACIEIARGDEAMIAEADVVRILEEAIDGEKGKEMRVRAQALKEELKKTMEDGGESILALEEFVRTIVHRSGGSH